MKHLLFSIIALCLPAVASALNIQVDYSYDTNNFFDTAAKKAAMQAAADRYSGIITTTLGAVSLTDDATDARIGFTHPGTGASFQVSSAASVATDAVEGAGGGTADEYRGAWGISAGTWIVYAGGRALSVAGQGGTGTGTNFTSVFSDDNSVLNRGFRVSGSTETNKLPVWGGSITFDNDGSTDWSFDMGVPTVGKIDFYTIALHELGHVFGLGTSWNDWADHSTGSIFAGANAVAAYNADNGTSVTGLNEVGGSNHHWEDGSYESIIFASAGPDYDGTVGAGNPQDLLMEPTANFVSPGMTRIELTNTDVGSLEDVGWSVVPEPSSALLLIFSGAAWFARRRR